MVNVLAGMRRGFPREFKLGSTDAFCEGIASPYLSRNARALADSPGGYDGPDDKYILKGSAHWQGGD